MKSKNKKNKIVGFVRAQKGDYSKFERLYECFTAKEIYQNFQVIKKIPSVKSAVDLTISGHPSGIYSKKIPNTSIEKSLAWCCSVIEEHKEKISTANNMLSKLCESILNSDGDRIIELLNDLDSICGVSVSSAILRASSENYFCKGDNHNGVNSCFGVLNNNRFLSYVIFYINGYFTDSKIYLSSKDTHKKSIEKLAYPEVKDFFKYRLFGLEVEETYDIASILNVDKNSSVIDIYMLLISIYEYIKVNDLEASFNSIYHVKHLIKSFEKVGFPYVNEFSGLPLSVNDGDFDKYSCIHLMDLYTEGKYSDVISCYNNYIGEIDFALLEITAKSYSWHRGELKKCFLSDVIIKMSNVILRNSDYQESIQYLDCLANSFRVIPFFRQLYYFVLRESPNKSEDVKSRSDKGTILYSKFNSPKKSKIFDSSSVDKYLNMLIERNGNSSSVYLHCYNLNYSDNYYPNLIHRIEKNRLKKYNSKRLIVEGDFHGAESILLELISGKDCLARVESLNSLYSLYLKTCQYEKAISIIVDSTLDDINYFSVFDTKLLFDAIEYKADDIACIELPIAYAMHSQNIDDRYDSRLKFSFENFLLKNSMKLPSELFSRIEEFGKSKVIYFLTNVCTPEVMKLYLQFDSAREIEECRLEICNYLIDNSSIDTDDIHFEIKNINRNLIVRKAVKQVENSRIYVDTSVFKGRKSQPFRAVFERYLEICNKTSDESPEDATYIRLLDALKPTKSNISEYWKSLSLLIVQDIKLSSKNTTFHTLSKLMAHEFTFGEKGINNYLSTRIRHGVLPTAIRKSSLAEGLFQPENSNIDIYEFSRKFPNISFSENDFETFISISRDFTKEIEFEITNFNDKRLQINRIENATHSEGSDDGMFNYFITPTETFALQLELPLSPTYDDLVKVVTEWLWHRTDYNLEQVKKYIRLSFTTTLNTIFDNLHKKVQNSDLTKLCKSTLANAISRAKSNLQSELINIASWFEHVDSDGDGSFDFSTAIEISKRSLNLEINLLDRSQVKIHQKNLSYWVDIFFILFENAISKSNIEKSSLNLSVSIEEIGKEIVIICTNKFGGSSDLAFLNSNLDFYRQKYGNEESIRNVIQKEGGTGFFKIWKILSKDLDINHSFDICFPQCDLFKIEIRLIRAG